ncbi:MAG: transporter substrate-binding domain-containing protein [Nibricoccus sp.]
MRADEAPAERDLNRPVICGSQRAFHPYTFVGSDGKLQGFAIDLVDAIARAVQLKIQWEPVPNDGLREALLSGQVDVIPFWGETRARRAVVDFSVPIMRFETVVVVRKGSGIGKPVDLSGKRVGVGQRGTVGELYMLEQQPNGLRVYAATTEEQVRSVATGELDAVVMSRLTAVTVIDRFGLKNLEIAQGVAGYDVRYCITVRKGEPLLLARFNEGLAVLNRTGEFDEIFQKWFGRYAQHGPTALQIVSYVAAALALVCLGAIIGLVRQRMLRARIARQAAELAEQRSLLAAMYDKHPLATIVIDVQKAGGAKVVSLNQEATLLYGLEKTTSVGTGVDRLNLTKELRSCLDEVISRFRANNKAERWEAQLPTARKLLEFAIVPIESVGEATRICILATDITRRRLMDQEIAKSRRLRALGELVGGIAHEFNNLLTPILATASLLRSSKMPATVSEEELNIIDQAAHRAADLTKRLLAFGRKTDDPVRSVRLTDAVTNCEALLKTMIDRRIEWINELGRDLPPVSFNPTDFNQIVFNLVLNARDTLLDKMKKCSDPAWRPRLRVTVREMPAGFHPPRLDRSANGVTGWQRFSVEDNGMGIPHEIVDRIFEPFYTTKEVGKGTGLGLSMVWHQVTEAGGAVEVDSKPGEGSVFHIYLPLRESCPPMPVPGRNDSNPPETVSARRILLAEDEPLVASTAARILERLGHQVVRKADGLDAWEELSREPNRYDLLLVDLSMPRLSGIDFVRKVRTLTYSGRIVVMSGRVSDEDLRTLKELGIDRVLGKPFTTDKLMALMNDLFGPGAAVVSTRTQ